MPTDTEPTYRYIKGRGWVPNGIETRVFMMGEFEITLQARMPEPEEYGFAENKETDIDATMVNLKNSDFRLIRLRCGEPIALSYKELENSVFWGNLIANHDGNWVTVSWKKL